jgi:hypothetical protein
MISLQTQAYNEITKEQERRCVQTKRERYHSGAYREPRRIERPRRRRGRRLSAVQLLTDNSTVGDKREIAGMLKDKLNFSIKVK